MSTNYFLRVITKDDVFHAEIAYPSAMVKLSEIVSRLGAEGIPYRVETVSEDQYEEYIAAHPEARFV